MSVYAVPLTVATTIGLSETDRLINKHSFSMRPVIGGFILGAFLYAIMELDVHLGTLFAVLIVLNAIIQHGSTVFGRLAGSNKA